MTREPFIAHSELTNEIYIVVGKEKYCITEQAIKAVTAIKALEQEDVLSKIRAEIDGLTYYWYEVHPRSVIDDVLKIVDKYRME